MTEGSRASWSLRGRMLRWLGLTTTVGAATLSLTGIWFVNSAANRQADALLLEELDEVRVEFKAMELNAETFEEVTRELDELHPGSRFGWRVWEPDGAELGGGFGVTETLRPEAPWKQPIDRTVRVDGGHRWRAIRLKSGHVVALMLDETPQRLLVDQYILVAVVFILVSIASIFFLGQAFAGKVSGVLARVASRAREVHASSGTLEFSNEDLPEEIFEVVQALEQMLANIRQETEASRVLIAGMAHELRAPIQNLIGEAEVALMSDREAAGYRALLDSQLDEMRHMADAVNNLVSLCSARRAAEASQTESFDLFREVRFRLQREINRAEREEVELSFTTRGEPSIRGDREAILTAVRNLVCNALDWTEAGGCIEVRLVGEEQSLLVTVEDDGPGIPEAAREGLFEPFVRGASAGGKRIGYGLGLALARTAVLAQGGRIAVGSSELGGARFSIELPRERPKSAQAAQAPEGPEA